MDIITSSITSIATSPVVPFDRSSVLWVLIVGIIMAFLLGAGLGANDVSNTFGTSVGSGVVTIVQAYILASIFITLGAVLVGWSVTDTMRKGVVDVTEYYSDPHELMLGQVAILAGTAGWLAITTFCGMPVSTTHAMVGSTLGFSLVLRGTEGVNWSEIYRIIGSWFLSPALSGLISGVLYLFVDIAVLRRNHPFECGLRSLPALYFFVIAFNVLMVTWDGSKLLHFDLIPFWGAALISIAIGSIAALLVQFVLKPRLWRKIQASTAVDFDGVRTSSFKTVELHTTSEKSECDSEQDLLNRMRCFFKVLLPNMERIDDAKTIQLFAWIQIFTACFAGFAIGANDVSNAIAPVATLVAVYKDQNARQEAEVPIYVLLFGVLAICFGLWTLGYRIIGTVGSRVSHINPASGFTIEFGAAMTTLIASKMGLPISTTQCLGRMITKTSAGQKLVDLSPVPISTTALTMNRVSQQLEDTAIDMLSIPEHGFPQPSSKQRNRRVVRKAFRGLVKGHVTHEKIGSVVVVGSLTKGGEGVQWVVFRNIVITWISTLPAAALMSAIIMWILTFTL